jgi:hypothetical protein
MLRDQLLLANEQQLNKSRDQRLANERLPWLGSKSFAAEWQ